MIDEDTPVLLGEGMSNILGKGKKRNLDGLRWMAREVLPDSMPGDAYPNAPRCSKSGDVHAFGKVVMTVLTEVFPYRNWADPEDLKWQQREQLRRAIAEEGILPSRPRGELALMMSDQLWDVLVVKAWNVDPEKRMTAADFVDILGQFSEQEVGG